MADVCVIYARNDAKAFPPILEQLLSPEVSVWWDGKIVHGNYRDEILHQIRVAGCVVPIWSPCSSNSMMVDEAEHARTLGIPLLPVIVHSGHPPLGFGRDHMTEAIGWSGEPDNPAIRELVRKIKDEVSKRQLPKVRPTSLLLASKLSLPAYFFSLSSYETKILPQQGVQALASLGVKSILVSAQDTYRAGPCSGLMRNIQRIRRTGGIVLLDSGNYEAGRIAKLHLPFVNGMPTTSTSWSLDNYYEALARTPYDMAFCFDKVKPPPNNVERMVASATAAVKRNQKHSGKPILPIVHLPYGRDGRVLTQDAAEVVVRVAKVLEPPMIGIPERELGEGIIARAATMKQIRTELNKLVYYQPVHVLGTGDPISLALLSAAGADSFDGLEWCRFVLDSEVKRLYPIQDYDLFQWQDKLSAFSEGITGHEGEDALTWLGKVAVHNIEFYVDWIQALGGALGDERRLIEFMTNLLPGNELGEVRSVLWDESS